MSESLQSCLLIELVKLSERGEDKANKTNLREKSYWN